jgi:hypothetical protein
MMSTLDMETVVIEARSHFKVVGKDSKLVHLRGKKRPDLVWKYTGYKESPDLPEGLVKILNSAVEAFGRRLLIENADNWAFTPTADNCSPAALYADLMAETTRSRAITKETLAAAGAFYLKYAPVLIGKSAAAALGGQSVIAKKLQPIVADTGATTVMRGNLESLVTALSGDSATVEMLEEFESVAQVYDWLLSQCEELLAIAAAGAGTEL